MSEKYKIFPEGLYFCTLTIVGWIAIFRPTEYCEEVIKNINYCIEKKDLRVYAFVIMPSHIHLIAKVENGNLSNVLRDFKSFTAKQLLKMIGESPTESRREWLLDMFEYFGKSNAHNSKYQFWQQNNHAFDLFSNKFIDQKTDYIHNNPVTARIVNEAHHYVYSSANQFCGVKLSELWNGRMPEDNEARAEMTLALTKVEVIKIDNSKPALNFKLKAFPNEWQKSTSSSAVGGETDTMTAYWEFYQKLIDDLRNRHKFTNAKVGQPQSWYAFSSGTKGIIYGASFARGNKVRIDLYIDTGIAETNKQIFATLKADRDNIEQQFKETLEWEELPNKRASRVAIYRDGNINDNTQSLEEIKNWIIDKLLRMKKTFGDRLPKLVTNGVSANWQDTTSKRKSAANKGVAIDWVSCSADSLVVTEVVLCVYICAERLSHLKSANR